MQMLSLSKLQKIVGGCRKMPGILYPENSDFARRSKAIAWQAAVESATGVSQLALQVNISLLKQFVALVYSDHSI